MEILHQTKALCLECDTYHPADVALDGNQVWGIIHCPKGDQEHLISSNAEMYLALNKKSTLKASNEPRKNLRRLLNYISITNACNFRCAVCAADSGGGKKTYVSVDEIVRRAEDIRGHGTRTVRLFGGEPTLHPNIREIIEKLTHRGFRVWMVSNGFLLGKNPGLALELKRCGLKGVCLQFDSLKAPTLDFLCRNYLDEKTQAIANLIHAGLRLGFNCTTTRKNLAELGTLLRKELTLGHHVKNLVFGSAAPVGRFDVSPEESVDREQIISSFVNDSEQPLFGWEDVFPMPTYAPWGAEIHPDCGVHVVLIKTSQGVKPLNYFIDVRKLYDMMGNTTSDPSFCSAKILPAYYVIKCIRPKKRWSCLRLMAQLLLFKKKYYVVNVAFVDYRAKRFLDQERISRCASAFYTSVGPVSPCLHFYQGGKTPGSLAYESAHGSC